MEPGADGVMRDFFISYAGRDRKWALWVARVLEKAGYSVLLQDWDFRPGSDWVHEMHRAAIECTSTIAILSHHYLRSAYGEAEWRAAYRLDPSGEQGRLIPIRIDNVAPPGLLATRVYIDIADLDEDDAEREILQGIHRQSPFSPDGHPPGREEATFPGSPGGGRMASDVIRDQRLANYLNAVAAQYEMLPYLALRATSRLSAVYVAQYVEDATSSGQDEPLSASRVTVDAIVESDVHVLIEGGPGAGKSSLVGHIATRLAAGGRYLPAVVRANTLHMMTGSFSERLRKSITAELGGRLIEPLNESFFASKRAGRKWFVLVDCLDEVVSSRDRARLAADLLHISTVVDSPYRILVATRPVPMDGEQAWAGFARMRLLPLTDEQIGRFATAWFREVAGDDGAEIAQRFTGELERRGLTDLVRTPLVLSMAASVYTPGTGHTLPNNRAGIYERFLELVDDEESERRTRIAFRDAWDHRYGRYGATVADDVFSSRRVILEHLAVARQDGAQVTTLLDGITGYLKREWHPADGIELDPDWLVQQAAALLTRSALVVPTVTDYEFLHETIREYLVATGLVRRGLTPSDPHARELVMRWKLNPWRQVVLFLLGIWSNRGENIDDIVCAIRDDLAEGAVFAANAIAEGVNLTPTVRDDTIRILGTYIRSMSWGQVLFSDPNPFRVMVSLGGAPSAAELLATAVDGTVELPVRAFSAQMVGELDPGPRAVDTLVLLSQRSNEVMVRHGAATALAQLGRLDVAVPVLEEVVSDPAASLPLRARAVDTLGRHDAVRSLLRVAGLMSLDPSLRETAAAFLETRGHDAEAAGTLCALIQDDRVDVRVKERALRDLGLGRQVDALRAIADDATAEGWIRVSAAMQLAHADAPGEAAQRLRVLAGDDDQDERVRLRAVHMLATLNDEVGLSALVSAGTGLVRLAAASGIPRRDNPEVLLARVRPMATDPGLEPDVRQEAADVLQRLGATAEAGKLLLNMARSPGFPSHVREEAVLSLCRGRHADALAALGEDTTLPIWLRLSACDALARISTVEAVTSRPFYVKLRDLASGDEWSRRRIESIEGE